MRILFVTPYVPSRVRIRPYAFIRELAARGHEITLVCLVQPSWEAEYLREVAAFCQAVHPVFLDGANSVVRALASLPTRVPLSVAYCGSSQFRDLLVYLDRDGEFDAIHTEFIRAAPATLQLRSSPKIYDAVDSLALAYRRSLVAAHVSTKQRLVGLLEWLKIRKYERSVLKHFDHLLVSSPVDRDALEEASDPSTHSPLTVIPNGVDLDYFHYSDEPRDAKTVMFLGKMSYYVNVSSVLWFYRQVLPLVWREQPDVRFQIVGREPVASIQDLAADPRIDVTGTVPDVRPYLGKASLSVVPMVSGAGIQNKMLESMAVGTPCVATTLATQALSAKPGRDMLVSDAPQGFAHAVLELLASPERRKLTSVNGRAYVENAHSWTRIGDRLDRLYQHLSPRLAEDERAEGEAVGKAHILAAGR